MTQGVFDSERGVTLEITANHVKYELNVEGHNIVDLIEDCARTYSSWFPNAEKVGQGGNGAVYRLGDLANKVIPIVTEREVSIARNEVSLLERLKGKPHVIQMIDSKLGVSDFGVPFLVLRYEFVRGEPLNKVIKYEREVDEQHFIKIIGSLVGAYKGQEVLRKENIAHRDSNPRNILVPEDNPLDSTFCDFSISSYLEEKEIIKLSPGKFVGSPSYIAPEILEGERGSPKTDEYILGIVTYEAITGQRFAKGEVQQRIAMSAGFDPSKRKEPHQEIRVLTNLEVADAWMRVMKREPEERDSTRLKNSLMNLYDRLIGNIPEIRN